MPAQMSSAQFCVLRDTVALLDEKHWEVVMRTLKHSGANWWRLLQRVLRMMDSVPIVEAKTAA